MIEIVGHTAIDHICQVSHLPAPHASTSVLKHDILYGGGAANIATGIAMLGEEVKLISAVGGDFSESSYAAWMRQLRINEQFFVRPKDHTATAFMFTDPEGNQMTFFEWGASVAFETEEAPNLSFVHMATADPIFNLHVAEKAKFSSFDPGQDLHRYSKEHLKIIFNSIDILIANHHEYADMCKKLEFNHDDLVNSVPMAIETYSANGSKLYQKGEETFVSAVQVTCLDPTGAGDGFRAGFLSGFARGYDSEDCCKIGAVTASFVVERPGCQTNQADWAKMEERFNQAFGEMPKPGPRRL